MKKKIVLAGVFGLTLALVLAFSFSLGWAQPVGQERGPEGEPKAGSRYIPVQGYLSNAGGSPISNTSIMDFNIYDMFTGGSPLCSDLDNSVTVENGLFSTWMDIGTCTAFDGRQLYLGITVGSDAEMSPRMYIDNVPYALSLKPGAAIFGNLSSDAIIHIKNTSDGSDGKGLLVENVNGEAIRAISGGNAGVFGGSLISTGVSGSSISGPGVQGESLSGVAIQANGRIASTEPTYLWISGNDARAFNSTDTTIFNLNSRGGVQINSGANVGNKSIVLPVTIAGTLYGQDVKLTNLQLYWKGETEFDGITTIRLRRQTGVCTSCYQEILADTTDYTCNTSANGCTINNNLTTNNVLGSSSGILYLTLELSFSGATTDIDFDGARLTLEYMD
jgi:hypothetical protein